MDRDEHVMELIYATGEVLGQEMRPRAVVMMVSDLAEYPVREIEAALSRCRAELTGKLSLAAILERIPSAQQHLPPNEAWALALSSLDEAETVVWTDEIANALGVAAPILDTGDKVGARMAFLSAYERAVTVAKTEGRQPTWKPSLGHDPQRREMVLQEAVEAGQLPAPRADALLPPPDKPTTEAGRAQVREITSHLREIIAGRDREAQRQRDEAHRRHEARRNELLKQAAGGEHG